MKANKLLSDLSIKKMWDRLANHGDRVELLEKQPVNNNILINSNFANPVVQRSYKFPVNKTSLGYVIDRWKSIALISKSDGYITLEKLEYGVFLQPIDQPELYIGKELTFSLKCRTTNDVYIYSHSSVSTEDHFKKYVPNDGNWHIVSGTMTVQSGTTSLSFGLSFGNDSVAGDSIDIEWAKLELGDKATPYVPRLYTEELVLCKRYYQVLEVRNSTLAGVGPNSLNYVLSIHNIMRVPPTVIVDEISFSLNSTTVDKAEYTLSSNYSSSFCAEIDVNKQSHGWNYTNYPTIYGYVNLDSEM